MPHGYFLADVFTDRVFGGNPLAVFPDGGRVPAALMPRIARELNLSETVFVLPADDPRHHARLRIFTPGMELPFAGHPTVGAACTLLQSGRIAGEGGEADVVFEEEVGPIAVTVRRVAGRCFATFTAEGVPEEGPPAPSRAELAELLGLEPEAILDGGLEPRAVSCGLPFLFVAVRDRRTLARARLQGTVWERLLADFWAPHVYVLTPDTGREDVAVRARMFAPAMNIAEDPATGAAAAALPGFLTAEMPPGSGTLRWRIEQGVEMGRPSRIEVEADRAPDGITAVRVGGESVLVGRGELATGE